MSAPKVTFKKTNDPSTTDCVVEGAATFQIEKNERAVKGQWNSYSVKLGGVQEFFFSKKLAEEGVIAYVAAKSSEQV